MNFLISLALVALVLTTSLSAASPADFNSRVGLQLWSLRTQMGKSVTAALDQAKAYGISEVETAGTGNLTPERFAQELRARGLCAVSAHVSYESLKKDVAGAIRDAKTLGARYLVCPTIPHRGRFTESEARVVATEFNRWGEACKAAGLTFGYHTHGFEFTKASGVAGRTVFDVLVRETRPDLVCFEMDVFWVVHAGQNPVELMHLYPDRWRLLHLKDLRKGAVTGLSSGRAAPIDNVAVGTGQIDWPAVLQAAREIGVEHFFIEDETPAPLQNIPASLRYLRTLKW